MKPRWVAWIAASIAMPAVTLVPVYLKQEDISIFWALLALAVALQLVASIFLGSGMARTRALGVGGSFALSFAFVVASLAVGTAIMFVGCIGLITRTNMH